MNIPVKKRAQGSALVVTMLVIFLVVFAIAVAMNMTTATLRQTDSSRDFSALRSAAEGALDFGYGVWLKEINSKYQPVASLSLWKDIGSGPSLPGFTYLDTLQVTGADMYGRPDDPKSTATPAPTRINLDNYPGWVGKNTSYLATVNLQGTFTGGRKLNYRAKRAINYTVVPLFQATAFFEDDLELFRPAKMTIGGLVATNHRAFVSSSDAGELTFTGHLSYAAPGGYLPNVDPPQASTWSGWRANSELPPTFANGGQDRQVAQVDRIEPLGADSASLLHPPTDDKGRPTGDKNPNDDSMRELIEPPVVNAAYPDPTPIADRRLFNKAGIVIKVTGSSYTITTQNGTSLSSQQVTALKSALSQQTIYDRREGQKVDITTLDVGKATAKVKGGVGSLDDSSFNNILYIYDEGSTTSDPKAVRLTNGNILPSSGLTVASLNPLYIQGDYNVGKKNDYSDRVSSAVFADAVTILSNAWKDSNSASALSSRQAQSTTVNTAIVAGFLPSGWKNPNTNVVYGYSGGLNNFPRFLEDWSNKSFTYNGSMIELFTSQIAIGEWDTGNIYSPPNRIWNFDSNFVDNPPPGSLDAVSIARGALVRF